MNDKKPTIAKLVPIVFAGNRYVVNADFGLEHHVPLMVHGNASMYLMLTHEIAAQLNGGKPIEKIRDYGYSDRGMGKISAPEFRIGARVFSRGEVRVFDWPEAEGRTAQGMLGLEFLKQENVRIDFVREQMEIGAPVRDEPDKTLLAQGYAWAKFYIENRRAYMMVYFDALEADLAITVGTVAESYNLDAVMFREKIKLEAADAQDHSPNGTTPQIYFNAVPVRYRIATQAFEIPRGKANFYSLAEYQNVSQAELFAFGIF